MLTAKSNADSELLTNNWKFALVPKFWLETRRCQLEKQQNWQIIPAVPKEMNSVNKNKTD